MRGEEGKVGKMPVSVVVGMTREIAADFQQRIFTRPIQNSSQDRQRTLP